MDANVEELKIPYYIPDTTTWIKPLVAIGRQAVSNNERLVVIAIARKMARLMEYHMLHNSELSGLFAFGDDNKFPIITEHAIPFHLSDLGDGNIKIVVVDDLIVYGDTVETVSENIYAQTGESSIVIAMAATEEFANNPPHWVDTDYMKHIKPLSKDEIPSFAAKCSWDIVSLKKPVDIEHTILSVSLTSDQLDKAKAYLEENLKSVFCNAEVYSIVHHIPSFSESANGENDAISITVLFNNESDNINNDFNKLRFFIGNNSIRIVSYAPNIWIGSDLKKDSFDFLSNELNECWRILTNHLNKLKYSSEIDSMTDSRAAFRLKSGFEYRNELSKVVLSNYLCSFENILKQKSSIITALENTLGSTPQIKICEEDLNLLIGSSFTKQIIVCLKEAYNNLTYIEKPHYTKWMQETDKYEPLVPTADRDTYMSERIRLVHLAPSLSSTLSLLFNYLRERFGLINNRKREDRIKIGETFESLQKLISQEPSYNNSLYEIHKWIDSKIDLGIVVPKYEQYTIPLGNYAWRRYFRAGEREDLMVDTARVAGAILNIDDRFRKHSFIQLQDILTDLKDEINSINRQTGGQVSIDIFGQAPHRIHKDKEGSSLELTVLWHYMIILEELKQESSENWTSARLNEGNKDNPGLYSSTAIYKQ